MPSEILQVFPPDRERKLRSIERFSMFDVFFYRSTLWHHQLRVALIVDELTPLARKLLPHCDTQKAYALALVHDDAEMITGDVQLGHKQLMSSEELEAIEEAEATAIGELAKNFPQVIAGYSYRELLFHALRKDCLEAQLVSYADKLDAYCESLHEVLGGNVTALRSVIGYTGIIRSFGVQYPALKALLSEKTPFTDIDMRTDPFRVHRDKYLYLNKPHSMESIRQETEFPTYNRWKALILEQMRDEGAEMLTRQKEALS